MWYLQVVLWLFVHIVKYLFVFGQRSWKCRPFGSTGCTTWSALKFAVLVSCESDMILLSIWVNLILFHIKLCLTLFIHWYSCIKHIINSSSILSGHTSNSFFLFTAFPFLNPVSPQNKVDKLLFYVPFLSLDKTLLYSSISSSEKSFGLLSSFLDH